jgi:GNAT superfamily N-acetyltransferase
MSTEANPGILLKEKMPGVKEYQSLRSTLGWPAPHGDVVKKSLINSLFCVCAYSGGALVGFGRVVGDGGLYFFIQDVMVELDFERQGIGDLIMDSIMNFLRVTAPPEAFIGMIASRGTKDLYKRYGFHKRPEDGPGMLYGGRANIDF